MAKPQLFSTAREWAVAEVLPPEFDADVINAFFAGRERVDPVPAAPEATTQAVAALQAADALAKADLQAVAQPLSDDWLPEAETAEPAEEDATINDSAAVKPDHAGKGGGKSDKEPGGKGWGKDKEPAPEDPVVTDPVVEEPVAEEPVAEEPVPQEPVTEELVVEEPVAEEPVATEPTGEINDGSTSANTYISGMDTPDGYNMELVFHGDWTDAMKQGFINAAEDISDIITGDIASHNGIDDVRLNLYAGDVDGSGGSLAYGGWMNLRDDPDKLVVEGGVQVDTADVDMMISKDIFEDMAFHEMLHAMGFGTTWAYTGLTEETADGTRFVGTNAIQAYNTDYADLAAADSLSDQGVPLSGDDAHWSQSQFGSEIMSPSLNYTDNIMSDLSIAALEDMGYETTYGDDFMFV